MAKYNVFNSKEDWAKFRKGLFTASEAHRLLGDAKREMTPEELEEAKRNKSKARTITDVNLLSEGAKTYVRERVAVLLAPEEPQYYNSNMERGNEVEPQAVMAYANKIGKSVNDDDFIYTSIGGFVFFSDDEHDAGGTPDIIIGSTICEIKCPLSKTHLEYLMISNAEELKAAVPQYYTQMQMNMWLCGATDGVFISYDDRYYNEAHHLHTVNVPRDEEHINLIKTKLLKAKEYKQQLINKING